MRVRKYEKNTEISNFGLSNRSVCRGNSVESDRDVGENLIAEPSACPLARRIQLEIGRALPVMGEVTFAK